MLSHSDDSTLAFKQFSSDNPLPSTKQSEQRRVTFLPKNNSFQIILMAECLAL